MLEQEREPKIGLLDRIITRIIQGPKVSPGNHLVKANTEWFYTPSLIGQPRGIKKESSVDETTGNTPNQ